MELNKTYFIKQLVVDGTVLPQDTCKLLKLNDDGTCFVANTDGEIRLFKQDMLSEFSNVIYGEMTSTRKNEVK